MNELKNLDYFKIKEFCAIFYNGKFELCLFLNYIKADNKEVNYVGRSPAASPASGYLKKHLAEQNEILEKVIGKF